MKKIKVCVFPAQSESAVEINNALSNCEGIEVFGATSIRGHNEFNFCNYNYSLPSMEEPSFIEKFERYLNENQIDVVFPANDGAVEFFAKNKEAFSATIVNSDYRTATICNDKKLTYELFSDCDFCPKIFDSIQTYPCFIKPPAGEGAIGAKLLESEKDLPSDFSKENYVILEYLPGKEITVDCITDCEGNLIRVLPRTREKVFSGMSVFGRTIEATQEVLNIATKINERLTLRGLWFFQIKQDTNKNYKLLEVSMRCAGTMCQTRGRGYNLPLLSVYTALGMPISTIDNDFEVIIDRTLFARYRTNINYSTVYIDYDGTIIVKEKVCLSIIRFLYQCKNDGKRIVLITRHNEDHDNSIQEDLESHGIAQSLFSEIICLTFEEEKSQAIKDQESIFIDNSYFERKKVRDAKGIPVFGVEGIDVLQDWRL